MMLMLRFFLAGVCGLLANALAAAEVYRVPAVFFFQLVQATSPPPTRSADGSVTAWNQRPEETAEHFADVPRVVLRSAVPRPFPERITAVFAVKPEDEALHPVAVAMTHEGEGSYSAMAAAPEQKAALIDFAVRHREDFGRGHVVLERVDGAPDWSRAVAAEEEGATIRLEVPGALPFPYPVQVQD